MLYPPAPLKVPSLNIFKYVHTLSTQTSFFVQEWLSGCPYQQLRKVNDSIR